jgi:hypothetical protein
MTYRVVYDICEAALSTADAVEKFFDQQSMLIATHGRRAAAYWFAPTDTDDDMLRVDLDFDTARAALRWLPSNTHGVELEPTEPIVVMESSDCPVVTIPAELARVSVDTAKRAVIEYVTTGGRPTCLSWAADSADSPSAQRP